MYKGYLLYYLEGSKDRRHFTTRQLSVIDMVVDRQRCWKLIMEKNDNKKLKKYSKKMNTSLIRITDKYCDTEWMIQEIANMSFNDSNPASILKKLRDEDNYNYVKEYKSCYHRREKGVYYEFYKNEKIAKTLLDAYGKDVIDADDFIEFSYRTQLPSCVYSPEEQKIYADLFEFGHSINTFVLTERKGRRKQKTIECSYFNFYDEYRKFNNEFSCLDRFFLPEFQKRYSNDCKALYKNCVNVRINGDGTCKVYDLLNREFSVMYFTKNDIAEISKYLSGKNLPPFNPTDIETLAKLGKKKNT